MVVVWAGGGGRLNVSFVALGFLTVQVEVNVFGGVECNGKRLIVSQDVCGDSGRFFAPQIEASGSE